MSVAVSEDNKPSSTILLYYVDDDLNFYFATHRNSFKAQKLLKNPLISLSVWEHKNMMIQVDGEASEVVEEQNKLAIIDKLAESALKGQDFWPPLLRIGGQDYIVFKIKPAWLRKLDLKRDTMTQEESPFSDITLG
jgi:nitroimidazol reductase NimA-like FMN-containing flavoprotein (pyridoxamine 5'-phosphate oxidase superfamily)